MKRAIVLSGGGGKGSYQIGVWKALRELGITYDIVVGTSIGAINGVFMVQNDYQTAFKLWNSINYDKVFTNNMDASYFTKEGKKKIVLNYAKGFVKGGMDTLALKNTITSNINLDKFYQSNIKYGLVTVKFPSMKPVILKKEEIPKDLLVDYLLASASCFPALKMTNINNEYYIDGGYHDNMPINLAINMGAKEVIAVDLRAIGIKKKIKNSNVNVTIITPKGHINNFLIMEKSSARKTMKIGYNDTMKIFNELEGDIYTFKKGSLDRNFVRIKDRFYENLSINNHEKNIKIKRLFRQNKKEYFNKILENTMKAFMLDETKIYRTSIANTLIKKAYKKENDFSLKKIKKIISTEKLSKNLINKEIICYLYHELFINKNKAKKIDNLINLFPDSYLCSIYLKTVMR